MMAGPLRVAWLGHQSGRSGDGLLTYSREAVAGLRARGVKVFFVHHGDLDATADDTLALKSLHQQPPVHHLLAPDQAHHHRRESHLAAQSAAHGALRGGKAVRCCSSMDRP